MTYAPILFISAKTGQRVDRLFELIDYVSNQASTRITTGMLNNVLADAQTRVQPPSDKGRRLKIYYMTQVGIRPPHFVVFCNDARLFHFSYQRYLENCIRNPLGLGGAPHHPLSAEGGKGGETWAEGGGFPSPGGGGGGGPPLRTLLGPPPAPSSSPEYPLRGSVPTPQRGPGPTNFTPPLLPPGPIVLKAVVAILIAAKIGSGFDPRMMPDVPLDAQMAGFYVVLFKYWAALFCLLGHMFPCMFHFKGGKGILSGGTIAMMMDWRIALVVWGGFLVLAILTRYVSLGLFGRGQLSFISWYCYPDPVIVVLAFVIGGSGGLAAPGQYPAASHRQRKEVQLPSKKTEGST